MTSDVIYCRTCYRHLAGKIGVQITQQMILKKIIRLQGKEFKVTEKGRAFFLEFNIDPDALQKQKKIFSKACLDGSERQYHLAGSLGSALFFSFLHLRWFRKKEDSRAILITPKGKKGLKDSLDLNL